MRVLARDVNLRYSPPAVAESATPGQVFIKVGQLYDVHAVAVFDGCPMLQIVDDIRYPAWYPAWLFDVVEPSIPDDWVCKVFREEPSLVLGPEFIAKSIDSYADMVELVPDQVDRFWKRVFSLDSEHHRSEDP